VGAAASAATRHVATSATVSLRAWDKRGPSSSTDKDPRGRGHSSLRDAISQSQPVANVTTTLADTDVRPGEMGDSLVS
jgi:hypothetical protein